MTCSDSDVHKYPLAIVGKQCGGQEQKLGDREKATALVQVLNAGSSNRGGEQWVGSGCILRVEQIDWKWDVRERGKSKLVA